MNGKLTIVGTPIGNLGDMSSRAVDALRSAKIILCEDTRRTLQLLNHFEITGPRLVAFHEHNEASRAAEAVEAVQAGLAVCLVSDAGLPLISDPGAKLVRQAINAGIDPVVIPGPNAALLALMVSGLPAERFVFEGFLPASGKERKQQLADIARETRTIILYESPHRLLKTLADLHTAIPEVRHIAVVRELTKLYEDTWRGTLGDAVRQIKEPRGEYVIVLEGTTIIPAEFSDTILIEALQAELATGSSKRDAVSAVATNFGTARDHVYKLAIQL
jgi:16S rRNA (cytidine1402-2'-O)-methyltransferase